MFPYNCSSAYLLLSITVIIITIFSSYLQFMKKNIFKIPFLTRWSLSHVLLYFILGSLCPNQFYEFMIIGLLWEIIERIFGMMNETTYFWTSDGWRGQTVDLIMNIIGYKLSALFFPLFHI